MTASFRWDVPDAGTGLGARIVQTRGETIRCFQDRIVARLDCAFVSHRSNAVSNETASPGRQRSTADATAPVSVPDQAKYDPSRLDRPKSHRSGITAAPPGRPRQSASVSHSTGAYP